MASQLEGRRVAFLVANEGVEQIELTVPWRAIERAGGEPVLVAPKAGVAQAFSSRLQGIPEGRAKLDRALAAIDRCMQRRTRAGDIAGALH